jgi:hypothetical protein
MGIFSSIKNAIFGGDDDKPEAAPTPAPAAAVPAEEKRAAIGQVVVAERLDNIPGADKLNWRTSIVDLMKLLRIDPSYDNRKELAGELGIAGYSGSAEDNITLHKKVLHAIGDAGGILPPELKD